jgi:hypothetical protein
MNSRIKDGRNRTFAATLALIVSLLISADCSAAWKVEEDVETPSYAVTEPTSSNLNIDAVVLMCEATDDARILQLKLYLTDDGPLRPNGVAPEKLKVDPRAEVSIDGQIFPVSILFADEFAVLADGEHDLLPSLSDRLLDAMAKGRRMVLRFDLAGEQPGQAAAFDGEAQVELGAAAISAVRRCATPPAAPAGNVAFAGH